jgi:hypothetical protein
VSGTIAAVAEKIEGAKGNMKDEAGPLWLLLESLLDWLGFWGRIAVAMGFVLALLVLITLVIRRKS